MPYYIVCSICGAKLDPGERCDCIEKAASGEEDREAAEGIITTEFYHEKEKMSNE